MTSGCPTRSPQDGRGFVAVGPARSAVHEAWIKIQTWYTVQKLLDLFGNIAVLIRCNLEHEFKQATWAAQFNIETLIVMLILALQSLTDAEPS